MKQFISRIIAAPIAALVTWLVAALTDVGIAVGPGFAAVTEETLTLLALAVFTAVYGVAHKLIDRYVNPADDAGVAR